jgi:hypothetical protein
MPKYRVKELSLIGNELFQAGAEVEYDGLPAENLEPLDDEGRAKYQEYLDSNAARVKKMIEENQASGVGDPAAFAAALAKSQADMGVVIGQAVADAVAAAFTKLFPDGPPTVATKGGKASLV